jgi:membrane-associated phospholipid phosphatase
MFVRLHISLTYIFIFSFLLNTTAIAQHKTDSICRVDKAYIKSYWTNTKGLITSPARWSTGEWIAAGTVVAGTAVLFTQDEAINDYFTGLPEGNFDNWNTYFFDPFGKMYYTIPLMGAFYIYGAATKKSKPKAVAMDFVQASLYSAVVVTMMKHIAHRHRPYQTDPAEAHIWDGPFTDDWGYTSFPSGHTIMAFTFASVVGTHYKKTIWVPIVVYSLAAAEGYSRMRANKHWASDVLVGAALGYGIGTFVVNHSNCKYTLIPVISSSYTGLSFTYSFNRSTRLQTQLMK